MITPITQEILERHLPMTHDVKGSRIFQQYQSALEYADVELRDKVLGGNIYSKLSVPFNAESMSSYTSTSKESNDRRIPCTLEDLRTECERYICARAVTIGMARMNLRQSANGGMTVATGNQEAIASQARVDALVAECRDIVTESRDRLTLMLPGNTYTSVELANSDAWQTLTRHLYWTKDEKKEMMGDKYTPDMLARGYDMLIRIIGRDTYNAMVSRLKTCEPLTATTDEVIRLARQAVAIIATAGANASVGVVRDDFDEKTRDLIDYIEENITDWPEYLSSNAYKARHAACFKNKKDAPGYFFL